MTEKIATKKLALCALLTAVSLALFLVENALSLSFVVPGAKVGLSQIVTLVVIYALNDVKTAGVIIVARTALASLFGAGAAVFFYSVAGAMASLSVMAALKKSNFFSPVGVSAAGGFTHNLTQLAVFSFAADTTGVFSLILPLGLFGIAAGIFTGAAAALVLPRIKVLRFY